MKIDLAADQIMLDFLNQANWSAESLDIIDVDESFGKIFKLNNVRCTVNNSLEYTRISGKTFIGSANYYIYHYIIEDLAQYMYLKTKFSDLKRFIFVRNEIGGGTPNEILDKVQYYSFGNYDKDKHSPQPHRYLNDTFNLFVNQDYIPDLKTNNFIFDEVYFVFDNLRIFKDINLHGNRKYFCGIPYWHWLRAEDSWMKGALEAANGVFDFNWWMSIGLNELKNYVYPYLNDNYNFDRIYLSRTDSNNRYQKYGDHSRSRYHSPQMNQVIEESFIGAGYHPVYLEGMDYIEQLSILKNAKSVASISGSGLLQTMPCSPGSLVMEIMVNKTTLPKYGDIVKSFGLRYKYINLHSYSHASTKTKEILYHEQKLAEILTRGQ